MEKNYLFRKGTAFIVIVFFIGASVVSGIEDGAGKLKNIDNENLNRDTLTFHPTDDCWIAHYNPNKNYNSKTLAVENEYGASSGWAADTLIKFDVSVIPQSAVVNYAVLKLYFFDWGMNNPAGRPINLYRVIGNWEEKTVTWNSQPSYASQPTTYTNVPSSTSVWMEWDVTSDILDFLSGMQVNCGWKLTDETRWGTYDIPQTWWRSKEYGYNIPRLEIHGSNIPNMPPSIPIIDGPASGQAGIAYVYSVVSNDPEGSELFYYVEWGDGNSSGWIGPYDSGIEATLEYTWSERGTYNIRVKAKDIDDAESEWGILKVRIPTGKLSIGNPFIRFLERFPRMFLILRWLLELE